MKSNCFSKLTRYGLVIGINSLLLASACGLIYVLVRHHLSLSREFYFWDNAGYYNIAVGMLERFPTISTLDFLRDLYHSFSDEISNLFAFPILPLMALLGTSRQSFILSLAFCYLLPTVFMISWLGSRYIGKEKLITFWGGTFILLLSPLCWSSVLDGRPDIGGVGLLLLVVLIATDLITVKSTILRYSGVGFSLAMAVLLRRSYLISTIAFFVAWTIAGVRSRWKEQSSLNWDCLSALKDPFWSFLFFCGVMLSVGYPFVHRYIFTGVTSQYSSYLFVADRGWKIVTLYILSFFSVPLLLISSVGLIQLVRDSGADKHAVKFARLALLFSCVWFLLWNLGKAPARHNYVIVLVWPAIMGALAFFDKSRILEGVYSNRKRLIVSISAFFAVECLLWGKAWFPIYYWPYPVVPTIRQDYDKVLMLVSDLREITKGKEKILIAGSSWVMNEGVLGDAEAQLVGRPNKILQLIGILHADSYKHIPINEILDADWVVVPTPFQWHMHPSVQQCVQVLHDAFEDHWEISGDFKKIPKVYFLAKGVKVELFQRIRKTDEIVSKRTEEKMRGRIFKDARVGKS